ncbi:hypothetical protein [Pseudanabaena sp. FACHB-2040]|uniref:hypothetical protein n=1 Tax=Pseudanabaena sp. FACHB-2040 TaxID=2692859 RepID=UPI00168978ED|nr:hypothetical protein [Pseudanabaena sp. FACHB-2040]MBD2261394.1 hypothetical protein [Pseudanabaena sp. FACHB-2040]
MANCLTYYLDLPSVQALQQRYGSTLQHLTVETRLHLMAALAYAASAVQQDGISERLDIALLDAYPTADSELLTLVQQLDEELTSWGEAVTLVNAIAESLCYASV